MTTHSFKSLSTLLLPLFLFLSHTHATLPLDASSLFFLSPSQHFALSHHRRSLSRSLSHTHSSVLHNTLCAIVYALRCAVIPRTRSCSDRQPTVRPKLPEVSPSLAEAPPDRLSVTNVARAHVQSHLL